MVWIKKYRSWVVAWLVSNTCPCKYFIQHSILAEQLAAGISRLKVVVSTFPPIVPSTSDPYQYGNDCQLITADTVSVKLKIVK